MVEIDKAVALKPFTLLRLLGFAPKHKPTKDILKLSEELDIGLEHFICPKHHDWYDVIDGYFPYMKDECQCYGCRNVTRAESIMTEIRTRFDSLKREFEGNHS